MRCAAREENYPLCPNARKSERETARERSPESPLVEDEEKTETKREEERKKIKREFEQRSAKINETRRRIIKKTSMLLKKKKKEISNLTYTLHTPKCYQKGNDKSKNEIRSRVGDEKINRVERNNEQTVEQTDSR